MSDLTHEEMMEIAKQREAANQGMNFTKRQIALLTAAINVFYVEVSETASQEFKEELMDLVEMFDNVYKEAE